MAVYYYQENTVPGSPAPSDYFRFGGSVKAIMTQTSELNIAEQIYADFLELPTPVFNAWAYMVFWNAVISQPTDASEKSAKTFNSQPQRYSFGHVCAYDSVGVAWDDNLRFQDQKVPLFRTHIVDGNPNPGGIPTEFETPLQAAGVVSYDRADQSASLASLTAARANTLGLFLTSAPEAIVTFNYYCTLAFNAADIIITNPLVGIFP